MAVRDMPRHRILKLAHDEPARCLEELSRIVSESRSLDEVRDILQALLTRSEMVMVMRRVYVAGMLFTGMGYKEIIDGLGVGKNTVLAVNSKCQTHVSGFDIAVRRLDAVQKEIWEDIDGEKEMLKINTLPKLMRTHTGIIWPYFLVRSGLKVANHLVSSMMRRMSTARKDQKETPES